MAELLDVIYDEIVIDGVPGDLWDKRAIHEESFEDDVSDVLLEEGIKTTLLNLLFPIGSLKIGGPNPGTYLGGTWVARPDVTIMGAGNKYNEGATGGSARAVVPKHTHSANVWIERDGSHYHNINIETTNDGAHTHGTGDSTLGQFNIHKNSGMSRYKYATASNGHYQWGTDSNVYEGILGNASATGSAGTHKHTVSGTTDRLSSVHSHRAYIDIDVEGEELDSDLHLPPYRAYNIWERTA